MARPKGTKKEKLQIMDENGNVKYAANKDLVSRKRYTTTFDVKIFADAKDLSEETNIPFSKIIDEALALYLQSVKANNNNSKNNLVAV